MPATMHKTDPAVTAQYSRLITDRTEWTMPDIAKNLEVQPQTVRSWRKDALAAQRDNPTAPPHPHHLPGPDADAHGRPIWYAGTIRRWAMQTGRMSNVGEPLRLKPPGRPRSQSMTAAQDTGAAENFDWAIKRAMEYIGQGDADNAWKSLLSDFNKHEGTAGIIKPMMTEMFYGEFRVGGIEAARKFIEGLHRPA